MNLISTKVSADWSRRQYIRQKPVLMGARLSASCLSVEEGTTSPDQSGFFLPAKKWFVSGIRFHTTLKRKPNGQAAKTIKTGWQIAAMLNLCIRVTRLGIESTANDPLWIPMVGKGDSMSKRKPKVKLSENEQFLVSLHAVVKSGSELASAASSLIGWYMANKFWTEKQLCYVRSIIVRHAGMKAAKRKPRRYWLYAISDGAAVKLGYSSSVGKRLLAMQTGVAQRLAILWKFYVGTVEHHARLCERKLHRACKKHHMRGEWFSNDCMDIVTSFTCDPKTIEK